MYYTKTSDQSQVHDLMPQIPFDLVLHQKQATNRIAYEYSKEYI